MGWGRVGWGKVGGVTRTSLDVSGISLSLLPTSVSGAIGLEWSGQTGRLSGWRKDSGIKVCPDRPPEGEGSRRRRVVSGCFGGVYGPEAPKLKGGLVKVRLKYPSPTLGVDVFRYFSDAAR